MSFNVMNKPNDYRKNKGKGQAKPKVKDLRGYYEASLSQRGREEDQLKEQTLKSQCSFGSFDHHKLESMRTITKSSFQILVEKEQRINGMEGKKGKKGKKESFDSSEKLSLKIFRDRIQAETDEDLEKLKRQGLKANVSTDIGRLTKLFMVAEYQLSSDKEDKWSDLYYTYRKIQKFDMRLEIKEKYSNILSIMGKIHERLDTIEEQFVKRHGSMPPLDETRFVKLDDWQLDYLDNILPKDKTQQIKSTIVQASTSAGKSILTGAIFLREGIKAIIVLATTPLSWQSAGMTVKVSGKDVPLITRTFQSETERDKIVAMIEKCGMVVGTPQYLLNYLPLIKVKWNQIVIDEIHMMGKKDSCEMEIICKAYSDIPIVCLSATIGNVMELQEWFRRIGHAEVDVIKCEKRFFNLQRFYFDKSNTLIRIHPLSSVSIEDIISGDILKKTLNITPPDIWDLTMLLTEKCKIGKLDPYKYFSKTTVIQLDESVEYFNHLLQWMVTNYSKNKKAIEHIIKSYHHDDLKSENVSLYDVARCLQENDKLPALFFQTDSHKCLDLVKQFSRTVKDKEDIAHPHLLKERLKSQKRAHAVDKAMEKLKIDGLNEKQIKKLMMKDTFDNVTSDDISLNAPHSDYIFNKNQLFTPLMIKNWNNELKKFFPQNGNEYHYIIDLLWRGVGVYVKGLPDPYLNIVQQLACEGALAIVFSDDSLVFGVSMPFRTSVITMDENIDSMMYHQMAGRAGRRGLDKEGNVIFVGYSWSNIISLSTSSIPNVEGYDTMFHGLVYASKLSDDPRWSNITKNFLLSKITEEDALEFYSSIETNLTEDGGWNFANKMDTNFLHMMWCLRHTEDCFRIAFLLPFIQDIFKSCNPSNENTQIEFSKFLLQFIDMVESKSDDMILSIAECGKKYDIRGHFERLGLDVMENVDSSIYRSIQMNCIVETSSIKEKGELRERLFCFGEKIRIIQNYYFHSKEVILARLLAKLLTRIWWIYHLSSPVMESTKHFIELEEDSE